jgi:hypothetical protein
MIYKICLFYALVVILISQNVKTTKVIYCDSVHVYKAVSRASDFAIAYNFSMDISLTAVDEFNTLFTITNFSSWSLNPDIYFQNGPIQYETDFTTLNLSCPSITGDCNITIFNALNGKFFIPLNNDSLYSESATFLTEFNFDNGVIFDDTYGSYFNTESMKCYSFLFPAKNKVCCTHFKEVNIPDEVPGTCVQLSGNTTFSSPDGTILSTLSTHYALTSIGIEYSITPKIYPNGSHFSLYPNQFQNALFLINSPITYYDYDSQIPIDLYLTMGIDFTNSSLAYLGETIAGRIIQRNEKLLKDQKTPYTPEDPCWESTAPVFSGSQAKNKFCCSKFHLPDSSQTCSEYQSLTKIITSGFYKGTYFNVKYQFNDTVLIVTILNYFSPVNSTLQVEAYSTDVFSQTCKVTTDLPQNTCTFIISKTNQYSLKFRTSYIRDGMDMTDITLLNNQITNPSLTPSKPCKPSYDFTSSQTYNALTEFCCISQPNGPWPGALSK